MLPTTKSNHSFRIFPITQSSIVTDREPLARPVGEKASAMERKDLRVIIGEGLPTVPRITRRKCPIKDKDSIA